VWEADAVLWAPPPPVPGWLRRLGWPWPPHVVDVAWTVFALVNLDAIFMFPGWETIPFHVIWASLTLVYGFRTWRLGPTLWIIAVALVLTLAGIAVDVWGGSQPATELTEDPLLALMFLAMAWHARRKLAAERSHQLISEHNGRLLADQRQFLQDAAHQLRTPITIALGHAELLAGTLTGAQESRDLGTVIGELGRLSRISERLLLIAAAGDPQFLQSKPVELDQLVGDLVWRWRPTADRCWRIGRLDQVTVRADWERLSLALDALLENAVRHTGPGDVIQVSAIRDHAGLLARIIIADTGSGIARAQMPLVFDRFWTGDGGQNGGTGLGLPLVRAVARAHGGTATVRSAVGKGSEFELTLPALSRPALAAAAPGTPGTPGAPAGTAANHGAQDAGSGR
jgi:signal transduction histidine kinase